MFKTIVWATDGSEAADAALPYAKGLADGEGHKLVVVHSNELLTGRAGGYPVYADEDELQTKIRHQADELRSGGLDVTVKIVAGSTHGAALVVAEVARELDADVIVVGTHGHTAIGGLLLGSVTQRLLHITTCPVLAVPASAEHVDAAARERETAGVTT